MSSSTHRVFVRLCAPAKLAVVTGGNQGIGLEVVRGLCRAGMRVILGSRDAARGAEAVETLAKEGLAATAVVCDITLPEGAKNLQDAVASMNGGVLDVLVNNAGLAYKGSIFGAVEAKNTFDCNVHGTKAITDALVPALLKSDDGRIVNVCSQAGRLGQVSAELQAQFKDPAVTYERITELSNSFIAAIIDDTYASKGWPKSMYGTSKLAEIALTRAQARDLPTLKVVPMCPGWCSTSMSSFSGDRTAAQGADTVVWLAAAPRDAVRSGVFHFDRAPLAAFEAAWN